MYSLTPAMAGSSRIAGDAPAPEGRAISASSVADPLRNCTFSIWSSAPQRCFPWLTAPVGPAKPAYHNKWNFIGEYRRGRPEPADRLRRHLAHTQRLAGGADARRAAADLEQRAEAQIGRAH